MTFRYAAHSLPLLFLLAASSSALAGISFVQVNAATPQGTGITSVTAAYTHAQYSGDVNVVVVGQGSTATVQSVTDTLGNTYTRAVGPTVLGSIAQSIYYAKSIAPAAANANTVTVTFASGATYPDVRIAEYGGIDNSNPVDVTIGGTGSSTTSSSGSVTTTNANDLLVGANTVQDYTSAPGTGYTQRIITNPNSDILEDEVVSAAGSYSATASLPLGGSWVMQMVAFRVAPPSAYVQGNYAVPQIPQTSVGVAYSSAQIAGDLNVVVVGQGSTATVQSVTDSKGNPYTRAVGPTVFSSTIAQSIYYAKNIVAAVANANTVTVTFSTAATYPDIRIAEYGGLDTSSPLDVTAGASGTGTTTNSASATTTSAKELLVGANTVQAMTTGPGAAYSERLLTNPNGDLLEDQEVTVTGSYGATAPQSPSGSWVMQMAAFKFATGGSDTQPPTAPTGLGATAASSGAINLVWVASSDNVGVTGYRIERCQGANCTSFAQIGTTTTATSFGDTGLAASTSYSYRVRANDAAGNLSSYSSTVSATTLTSGGDTQPPTAPSSLAASAVSSTQINLSWTASTDNVGVTGYLLERCQGTGCATFVQVALVTTTTYNDTGLSNPVSYSYRVRAKDAAGNLSSYSNTATAATSVTPPGGGSVCD
jgi:chitodextrinase